MKRFLVVATCVAMICGLCACNGVEESPPSEDVSSEQVTTPVVSEPIEIKPVTLTEEHVNGMMQYLRGCTYISFMQTMENGVSGQAEYATTRYSITMNTEQGVHGISMRYITVDGINREGVGYKLYSDGDNIVVSEDGVWANAGVEYETLCLDMSQFTNAEDVFEYLLRDIELPVGIEGEDKGGYWTIEYTEPAVDSLIAGLEYDSLGDATYKFTFREKDGVVTPDSVSVRVDYIIEEVTYYVASEIQLNSFGNTKVAMPVVGTAA